MHIHIHIHIHEECFLRRIAEFPFFFLVICSTPYFVTIFYSLIIIKPLSGLYITVYI
jgi:hypothetical protein